MSKVTVVPFYDRTQLIKETIGTLESALTHEVLICIIVVLILVLNLRASVVIAGMLPLAVLATFIVMKLTNIEANIVALSGIAIAIGVMVDVGVVLMENVVRHLEKDFGKGVHVGGKLPEDVKTEVQGDVDALKKALEGDDDDAVKSALEKLQASQTKLGEALYASAQAEANADSASSSKDDEDVVDAEVIDEDEDEKK